MNIGHILLQYTERKPDAKRKKEDGIIEDDCMTRQR
jgi:hypothetical protein